MAERLLQEKGLVLYVRKKKKILFISDASFFFNKFVCERLIPAGKIQLLRTNEFSLVYVPPVSKKLEVTGVTCGFGAGRCCGGGA